jgi:hypothetical protein
LHHYIGCTSPRTSHLTQWKNLSRKYRNLCTTGAQSSKIRKFCGVRFLTPIRPCPHPGQCVQVILANHANCSVTWEEGLWRRCRIEVSQYPGGYQWRSTRSLLSDGARSYQLIPYCRVLDAQIKNGPFGIIWLPSEMAAID